MAESSTSSVKCQTVSVEWIGIDGSHGETRHLCHSKLATSREITFDIYFDSDSQIGFFKLRVPVDLKSGMTMLYLYISPDRITSLVHVVPESQTGTVPYLRIDMSKPADLIVPLKDPLLLNKPKLDGNTLDSLKVLAQETTMCVYMAHDQIFSETLLRPLCASVTDRSLKPVDMSLDLSGLYKGSGTKILQGADLRLSTSLPSYDELGESPASYPLKQSAAPASASRKRPRASPSESSGNESQDIRSDFCRKPTIESGAYVQNQLVYEEFVRFRDEFQQMATKLKDLEEESQQMKTKIKAMEEESQQMRAEVALIKRTTVETDSQETADTSTGKPTLSQLMRTRLGVYSKVEVEDRIHDGIHDSIVEEELCKQEDVDAHFEEFEDHFESYTKLEIDDKLEEIKQTQRPENLARELQDYFCNADDVDEILHHKLRDVYTKEEMDNRLYELRQSCEGINNIETEELILDARSGLEKDVMNEIKDAKADLQDWTETAVRLKMKSTKKALKQAVRLRMQRRRLSHMPPWRKFPGKGMVVISRGSTTATASLTSPLS